MERIMVVCPRCSYIGSVEKGAGVPNCPSCGSYLALTQTSMKEYSSMTDDEKEKFAGAYREPQTNYEMNMGAEPYMNSQWPSVEESLYYLEKDNKRIANWISFWSILALIPFIIAVIALLTWLLGGKQRLF